MNPHLTTSASPATKSCRGSDSSDVEVAQHAGRRVERADEVLALGRVDAGLAADGGVDHAEQRRRHVHDADPAQPGRGDEAGEVGRRAAADADDRVGAGEAGLAEHRPEERRDLRGLGRLAVGDLERPGLASHWLAEVARATSAAARARRVHDQRRGRTRRRAGAGSSPSRPGRRRRRTARAADASMRVGPLTRVASAVEPGPHDVVDDLVGVRPAVSTRTSATRS